MGRILLGGIVWGIVVKYRQGPHGNLVYNPGGGVALGMIVKRT